MKNFFIACAVLILCLSSMSSVSADMQQPRTVRVAAFNYYPGIFKDSDGVVKGFYVDALADLGRRENIRFEYVHGSWSEGLERIQSGEVDVLTSVAYTPERARFLDYATTPLLTVWGELYVPLASEIDGISAVQGKKIAVMRGDFNARHFIELVQKFGLSCQFIEFPGFEEIFAAVTAGKVDGGVVNSTFGAAKQKAYGLRSTGVVFNPFDIYFAVAKGKNQDLLTILDNYLEAWRHQADSPYNQARQKWSHYTHGTSQLIPRWLVNTLAGLAVLAVVAVIFIAVLKKQVWRATSDLRQREAHLQEGEAKFRSYIDNSPDGVFVADDLGRYREVNPAASAITGYSQEELLGMSIPDLIPPDALEVALEHFKTLKATGRSRSEFEFLHKSGRRCWWSVDALKLSESRYLGFVRETTEHRRAQQTLQSHLIALTQPLDDPEGIQFSDLFSLDEIQRIQDSFAQATGVASIITSPDGTPLTNPSNFCRLCRDIIRRSEKGFANCSRSDAALGVFSPDGPVIRPCLSGGLWDAGASISVGGRHIANWLIGQVKNEEQDESEMLAYADEIGVDRDLFRDALAEVTVMSKEQFEKVALALYSFANELSHKAYQNIQQGRFIAERKEIERELQDKNSELERFSYTVSHDLKSPLITIQSYAGMIKKDLDAGNYARAHNDLTKIEGAAAKMTDLLNDLLELSRVGRKMNQPSTMDLNTLVKETLMQLAGPIKQGCVTVEVQSDFPIVVGDQKRIAEVLQNLIENAIKYMGDQAAPNIEIGTRDGDTGCVFFVRDNGIGIDPRFHLNIFGLFNKLDPKSDGTGVGLALVKRIIEYHDGRIWVESAGAGLGSTFCFTLPEARNNQQALSQNRGREVHA